MTIMALRLVGVDTDSWIIISPVGKVKHATNDEFIKQIARPHTLEYSIKVFDVGDTTARGTLDAFDELSAIPYNIVRDISDKELLDFCILWGI